MISGFPVHTVLATLAAAIAIPSAADTNPPADFNGDGHSDLLIGLPGKLVNGIPLTDNDQGAVFAVYSNGTILSNSGADFFHQDTSGIAGVAEINDFFGQAVATGDFNNDGYSDAVIGAPGENFEDGFFNRFDAGMIHVIYGSSGGLTSSGDESFHQDSANIQGEQETGDFFGSALAVGDFDADGYDDVAVGVPGEDIGSGPEGSGLVHILYGNAGGVSGRDQMWHQENTGVGSTVAEFNDEFGTTLATGDFDGDGYDDLAIGAPREDIGNEAGAGLVTVLYGGSSGLSASGDQVWGQDSTGIQGAAESDDFFGGALAAGDFDNDGFDDLAVGVPEENLPGGVDAGAVAVLFGSGGGLTNRDAFITLDSPTFRHRQAPSDEFGSALAVGDFDGDGVDDLAVSAPKKDDVRGAGCGMVWVMRFDTVDDRFEQTALLPGQGCVTLLTDGEYFGASLTALDINGDGISDLAVGAPNGQGTTQTRAGKVYYYLGPVNILNRMDVVQQDRICCSNPESPDDFGSSLSSSSWRDR